ncbi:MAG: C13 family peptidase [Pseudomonadota bacterium]
MRAFILGLLLIGAACAPAITAEPKTSANLRWRAVIVAGDDSLPVWENATARMASLLGERATIRRFSDRSRIAEPAEPRAVLSAIAGLRPAQGEGCLIYMTMHGAPEQGLVFAPAQAVVSPSLLDRALTQGCGEAPTVAILSGCFTGIYADALARPNRIVMMAARRDRPSFGCGAGEVFTVYDECLLKAYERGGAWVDVARATTACVSMREQQLRVRPSEPQITVGDRVTALVAR